LDQTEKLAKMEKMTESDAKLDNGSRSIFER